MEQIIHPASRPVGRRAGLSRRGSPVIRGALLAVLSLLVGSGAWATNITSCPFKITAAGDYHVTQDLTCSSTSIPAIEIDVHNVTLSLDGHTITGPGRTQFQATCILVNGFSNVQISNGTISSFGIAVDLSSDTTNSSVSGLTVTNCDEGVLIEFGTSGVTVSGNSFSSGDVGIDIGGPNNTINNNTANGNETGISINDPTATGNVVEGNTALGNSSVDLADITTHCDSNTWMNNCFGTKSQSCIGTSVCGQSSITCPPDQTVTVPDSSHPSATVDPGMPTSSLTGVPVVGVRSDGHALTAPYPAGTTTITWTANPGQENAATCTQTITVLVGNAPQITCPGNLAVTAPLGQTGATVVVGTATSTTEGAIVAGMRSDGKGLAAPYPVGTTTITWIVTLRSSFTPGSSTCTQTITVQAAVSSPAIIRGPNQADPHLDCILVNRGPIYQRAILHGRGFADVQGTSYVTLGGNQIPVLAWTNDAINVLILPQAWGQSALPLNAAYPVQVVIYANGRKSNTIDFFLTDGPPAN